MSQPSEQGLRLAEDEGPPLPVTGNRSTFVRAPSPV